MTTGVTWHCSHCDYGVPQAPNSAARALPEQCPNCKHVNVMWTTKEIARVSLFSRLHKLNKEATPGEWEAVDDGSRGARILTNAEGRLYVTPRHDEFSNPWLSNEDAALIVECRNSLPAVLNLIEAAERMVNPNYDGWKALEAHDALAEAVAVAGLFTCHRVDFRRCRHSSRCIDECEYNSWVAGCAQWERPS